MKPHVHAENSVKRFGGKRGSRMSEEKLKSALWRACLHIAKIRGVGENILEKTADDMYDCFLENGSENERLRYEFKKGGEEANEQLAKMPKWKREWMKAHLEVNEPESYY